MRTISFTNGKAVKLILIILSLFFLAGCKYPAVSVKKDFSIQYESGAFIPDWVHVTDQDDLKELRNRVSSILKMDQFETFYSVELILLKQSKFFQRDKAG